APEPLVAEALSILERVRGGQEWSGELLRRRSDGSTVQVRVVQQPLRDNHGRIVGVVGSSEDAAPKRPVDATDPSDRVLAALAAERDARFALEVAAARLAGLHSVTAALARAVDPAAVAEVVLNRGLATLGGRSASLCLVAADGVHVDIVHDVGYAVDVKERWSRFRLDGDLPASEAIRSGRMVLMESPEARDRRYPAFVGTPVLENGSWAVVPLHDEDGSGFGALVIGFASSRSFVAEDLRMFEALAHQAAGSLRRAQLFETTRKAVAAEAEARRIAEESQDRLAFLADASAALASSLDYELTLATLADLAVPRLADWCAVHLVDDRGRVRPLAVASADPTKLAVARRLAERFPVDPGASSGIGAVIRTGEPEVHYDVPEEVLLESALDDEHRELLLAARFGSAAILPMRARKRVVGTISLLNERSRPMSPADVNLAGELAIRAGVAVDNALLFADRSRVARGLQASLLPPNLPSVNGLDLGARHLAAGEGNDVGGDFYDVFSVDDRWLIAVGDVRGKGVEAAAVTGLARHTIRSVAMAQTQPSGILSHLNQVLLQADDERAAAFLGSGTDDWQQTEPRFCTVALISIEMGPGSALATVCCAGHPLPLVARASGGVATAGEIGSLLGVTAEVQLHDVTVELGPGDMLVCFTDGITERHEGRRFFEDGGVASLLEVTRGDIDAATVAARIEEGARSFVAGEPQDDMAVVVVRLLP
ncbi:MAG: SpoIIE family protein phosphatase, partial [Acidimicrobiales bacterium]